VIAGGSRGTGRVLAEQARAAGHEVRVVDEREHAGELRRAVTAAGAVAIIPARGVASLSAQVHAVLAAALDTPHVILITGFSIGHGMAHALNTPERLRDRRAAEDLLRGSGLPYTIVRPTWLTSDPPGHYAITLTQDPLADGMIGRADLAAVCLAAVAEPASRGKTFAVFSQPGAAPLSWSPLFSGLRSDAA
jgi:uncharacterized protein YbjT (DUF2867 family)